MTRTLKKLRARVAQTNALTAEVPPPMKKEKGTLQTRN